MRTGLIVCVTNNDNVAPIQLIYIGKKRVIDYTLENVFSSCVFDDVIIVARPDDLKLGTYAKYIPKGAWVIQGDVNDQQETKRLGLEFCKLVLGYQNTDIIGITDGNRPFLDGAFYKKLVDEAKVYDNAVPFVKGCDDPIMKDGKVMGDHQIILSPCIFPFGVMYDAYNIAHKEGSYNKLKGTISVVINKLQKMNITGWIHYVEGKKIYSKIVDTDDVRIAKLIMKSFE